MVSAAQVIPGHIVEGLKNFTQKADAVHEILHEKILVTVIQVKGRKFITMRCVSRMCGHLLVFDCRFLSMLEEEVYGANSPIWDPEFIQANVPGALSSEAGSGKSWTFFDQWTMQVSLTAH